MLHVWNIYQHLRKIHPNVSESTIHGYTWGVWDVVCVYIYICICIYSNGFFGIVRHRNRQGAKNVQQPREEVPLTCKEAGAESLINDMGVSIAMGLPQMDGL